MGHLQRFSQTRMHPCPSSSTVGFLLSDSIKISGLTSIQRRQTAMMTRDALSLKMAAVHIDIDHFTVAKVRSCL